MPPRPTSFKRMEYNQLTIRHGRGYRQGKWSQNGRMQRAPVQRAGIPCGFALHVVDAVLSPGEGLEKEAGEQLIRYAERLGVKKQVVSVASLVGGAERECGAEVAASAEERGRELGGEIERPEHLLEGEAVRILERREQPDEEERAGRERAVAGAADLSAGLIDDGGETPP